MKLKNIPFGQLAMEFISVVFAVLLALGLNHYKETQSHESEAKKLKEAILNEFQANKIKIDSIILKNKDYFNYLDSLIQLERDEVSSVQFRYDLDLLTSAAWYLAQNNPSTNLLEQGFLLDVAELYQAQDFFTDYTSSFFQTVGVIVKDQEKTPPYDTALSLYFNMSVLMNAANDLSKGYGNFIKKYPEKSSNL